MYRLPVTWPWVRAAIECLDPFILKPRWQLRPGSFTVGLKTIPMLRPSAEGGTTAGTGVRGLPNPEGRAPPAARPPRQKED